MQHEWYEDHSELDWRDRGRAEMDTYISNMLENDRDWALMLVLPGRSARSSVKNDVPQGDPSTCAVPEERVTPLLTKRRRNSLSARSKVQRRRMPLLSDRAICRASCANYR
jgi:hypothetical protein